MTQEIEIQEERVVRRINRALRAVNKTLRRRVVEQREHNDDLFRQLCEHDQAAAQALREIWERAELKCSPDDYEHIVGIAVEAISRDVANERSKLKPAVPAHMCCDVRV